MALVNWTGGTHRITDPGVWTPHAPASGDTAAVAAGHVVATGNVLGSYDITLDGGPTQSTFDAVGTTIYGFLGSGDFSYAGDDDNNGHGTVTLLGTTTVTATGSLGASGLYLDLSFPSADIVLADVADRAGTVIQQARLLNAGYVVSSEGSNSTIRSPSADALLINNGTLFNAGLLSINVPIFGTGAIETVATGRDPNATLTLSKAVGSGQTVSITSGALELADPYEFRATILLGANGGSLHMGQPVSKAVFGNHLLTLTGTNSKVVAQLRFGDDTTAADIAINTGGSGTTITASSPGSAGNVAITSGTVAALAPLAPPAAPATLPTSGGNLVFTTGAHVASAQTLDGYTVLLQGAAAATAPSVAESDTVFGPNFTLRVQGAGPAAAYGTLSAVGINTNKGLIETKPGSGNGPSKLSLALGDIVSPTGTTVQAGCFINGGTIHAAAGTQVDVTGGAASKLINTGTLQVDGMLFLGTQVAGTGKMAVSATGTLKVGYYVEPTETIALKGGALLLDQARTFRAAVTDFNAAAKIVIEGVNVTSITYMNNWLVLDNGSKGAINLVSHGATKFNTSSFVLGHSGADTVITTKIGL